MRFTEEEFNQLQARQAKSKSPAPKQSTSKAKLQALGRLKTGQMNKTESRFHAEWIAPRVLAGEIVWWCFEAITLKIAEDCRITIDFFIMLSSGELQAIDVKGSSAVVMDDALVKLKVAADKFPWPVAMVMPKKKTDGGGWEFKWVK